MKYKNPLFAWLLAVVFLFIQVVVLAQDDTYNKDKNKNETTQQKNTQEKQNDDNILGTNDEAEQARYDFADKMAKNLMSKIDLSLEETEKVRDILIDYQEDVFDAKKRYTDNDALTNKTTTDRNNNEVTDNDNTPMTNDDNEVVGSTEDVNDKMEAYQDADRDANDKIEDALEDEKIVQYNNVKKDWWSQIKNHVHSVKIDYDNSGTEMHNRNDAVNPTTGSETK